jgi:hypothetical protein
MGEKRNNLIVLLILWSFSVTGQDKMSFSYVDSLTYNLYLDGNWSQLIREANSAINAETDYKFLRQRVGYAYFVRGDFYSAERHFRKALEFDSYDQFTLRYLYWSYLNTGKEQYAGYIEKLMLPDLAKALNLSKVKPVRAIDFEISHKFSGSRSRSDASFYRIGIDSKIGSGLNLYQSVSHYSQTINDPTISFRILQPSYYAFLSIGVSKNLLLKSAFHYARTSVYGSLYRGRLFMVGIAPDLGRLRFDLNGFISEYYGNTAYQPEFSVSYVFPGRSLFYLSTKMAYIISDLENNRVVGFGTGLKLSKKSWIEHNSVFGKMNLYSDFDGLYIYNSYDPMIMRSGATFTYFINDRINFWINFSLEQKEFFSIASSYYNQYSILGGLKWKI